jgi:hypothetical protein
MYVTLCWRNNHAAASQLAARIALVRAGLDFFSGLNGFSPVNQAQRLYAAGATRYAVKALEG